MAVATQWSTTGTEKCRRRAPLLKNGNYQMFSLFKPGASQNITWQASYNNNDNKGDFYRTPLPRKVGAQDALQKHWGYFCASELSAQTLFTVFVQPS